ncbi:MAG: hypothetical protein ACK41C_18600 [Phenylobacterium sp.]|uniref:hypothetical protein n=1 Tax=Phenylobacterium sp. TaxID=1871053 RepID=UPI003918DA49
MFPLAVSQDQGSGSSEAAPISLYLPVGAASPLWPVFAGAVGAGLAYWWMTRWPAATNLEALLPHPVGESPPGPEPAAEFAPAAPEPAVPAETVKAVAEAAQAVTEQVVEAAAEPDQAPVPATVKPSRPRPPRPPEA